MFCVLFSAPLIQSNGWITDKESHTLMWKKSMEKRSHIIRFVMFDFNISWKCAYVCVSVVDFIWNVFNHSKAAKSLSVRACLRKYNKKHLFGNKSIGIKVHLHRNQSEIDFQIYTLNTRLLFFIGWKLLFLDIRWKPLFVVKSSQIPYIETCNNTFLPFTKNQFSRKSSKQIWYHA